MTERRTIVVPPSLTVDEHELFCGALDIACQLAESDDIQHNKLSQIIGGLCAIIVKRDPDLLDDNDGETARTQETEK